MVCYSCAGASVDLFEVTQVLKKCNWEKLSGNKVILVASPCPTSLSSGFVCSKAYIVLCVY